MPKRFLWYSIYLQIFCHPRFFLSETHQLCQGLEATKGAQVETLKTSGASRNSAGVDIFDRDYHWKSKVQNPPLNERFNQWDSRFNSENRDFGGDLWSVSVWNCYCFWGLLRSVYLQLDGWTSINKNQRERSSMNGIPSAPSAAEVLLYLENTE